ncbi:unnamed protein product [[Candida] boidinii]|uniref:Unnamed protein product n=1 Tax=Candida boidinii TaxID=5477 RepID=A0A9W6STR7_CANBO|nr:hypothetical protein B5S30_g3662 [[Candida] boidinii]OWB83706.1 hypothetical protein B5S33_g2337 [[Candida] boidinii]GME66777.1 unnamed protein product [[Candida] boidinii]GMG02540.1 unnamed protein product [[Candida] boidinii]
MNVSVSNLQTSFVESTPPSTPRRLVKKQSLSILSSSTKSENPNKLSAFKSTSNLASDYKKKIQKEQQYIDTYTSSKPINERIISESTGLIKFSLGKNASGRQGINIKGRSRSVKELKQMYEQGLVNTPSGSLSTTTTTSISIPSPTKENLNLDFAYRSTSSSSNNTVLLKTSSNGSRSSSSETVNTSTTCFSDNSQLLSELSSIENDRTGLPIYIPINESKPIVDDVMGDFGKISNNLNSGNCNNSSIANSSLIINENDTHDEIFQKLRDDEHYEKRLLLDLASKQRQILELRDKLDSADQELKSYENRYKDYFLNKNEMIIADTKDSTTDTNKQENSTIKSSDSTLSPIKKLNNKTSMLGLKVNELFNKTYLQATQTISEVQQQTQLHTNPATTSQQDDQQQQNINLKEISNSINQFNNNVNNVFSKGKNFIGSLNSNNSTQNNWFNTNNMTIRIRNTETNKNNNDNNNSNNDNNNNSSTDSNNSRNPILNNPLFKNLLNNKINGEHSPIPNFRIDADFIKESTIKLFNNSNKDKDSSFESDESYLNEEEQKLTALDSGDFDYSDCTYYDYNKEASNVGYKKTNRVNSPIRRIIEESEKEQDDYQDDRYANDDSDKDEDEEEEDYGGDAYPLEL